MSVASEINRLNVAKANLKLKLNGRNDENHQIGNETIDDYYNFVDSIPTGSKAIVDHFYYSTSQREIYIKMSNTQTSNDLFTLNYDNLMYEQNVDLRWLDVSNLTTLKEIFKGSTSTVTLNIEGWDTHNVTSFDAMFHTCSNLTIIPELDASSANDVGGSIFYNCTALTNFGGFKDLGKAYDTSQASNYSKYRLNLSYSTSLTHDSLMNVINNLYDIATAGVQTQQLILGSTNLAKLSSAEIAIATNKGWTVS